MEDEKNIKNYMNGALKIVGYIGWPLLFLIGIYSIINGLIFNTNAQLQSIIGGVIGIVLILFFWWIFVKLNKHSFAETNFKDNLIGCSIIFYVSGLIFFLSYIALIISDILNNQMEVVGHTNFNIILGLGLFSLFGFWTFFNFINGTPSSLLLSRCYIIALFCYTIVFPLYPYPEITNLSNITISFIIDQIINIFILTILIKGITVLFSKENTSCFIRQKSNFLNIFLICVLLYGIFSSFKNFHDNPKEIINEPISLIKKR